MHKGATDSGAPFKRYSTRAQRHQHGSFSLFFFCFLRTGQFDGVQCKYLSPFTNGANDLMLLLLFFIINIFLILNACVSKKHTQIQHSEIGLFVVCCCCRFFL